MDDLIERLRRANPEPHPESLPIEYIWERITDTDVRSRQTPSRRMSPRSLATGFGAALVVACCVAILVVIASSAHHRGPARRAGSQSATGTCVLATPARDGAAVQAIVRRVALLRRPATGHDLGAAACQAQAAIENFPSPPADPSHTAHPEYLRYVERGDFGGEVFMYVRPGISPAAAHRTGSSESNLARFDAKPAVCLITVGGRQGDAPSGCVSPSAIKAGVAGVSATQIEGAGTSVLAIIVPDGISAVSISLHGRHITTAIVLHNVVQAILDHDAATTARMHFTALHR